ncbi:MAG TPA: hypothetical protein VMD25_14035 [Acidobacteriaceae bacterium]|nr:hypothetical protein [Acidobacteriaceae bacterium]
MRHLFALACALALPVAIQAQQPNVQVQPPDLHGSRALEKLTESSVVHDYLESWQMLGQALNQNRADLLTADFAGEALGKFTDTITDQTKFGIHTRYQERGHNLQIVFYSPDGLSIQLIDTVDYDEQVMSGDKVLATQPMHARYVAVLTPSQTRWMVRVLQTEGQ